MPARGIYLMMIVQMKPQMEQTIEHTLEEHHLSSFGWALACCRWNRDEAQEALQTTYLKILDGRARLNGNRISRAWVFGVIRKTALEQRRRLLARLSARQRELLHLVFYQDMTIEQAAEVLGISAGTARVHYERGKAHLRALLAQEEHP